MRNNGLPGRRYLMQGLRSWLLAASLIFAQVAMLAHAAEHVAAEPVSHVCIVCLSGHNAAGAPPPAAFSMPVMPTSGAFPAISAIAVPFAFPVVFYPARGPPSA
ncbi:MAG: hypothetical protein H6943_03085 [Zoogloeaceae bacterium]|nr:hypothetical protein [Zoogloeaceae bacterium]